MATLELSAPGAVVLVGVDGGHRCAQVGVVAAGGLPEQAARPGLCGRCGPVDNEVGQTAALHERPRPYGFHRGWQYDTRELLAVLEASFTNGLHAVRSLEGRKSAADELCAEDVLHA